MSCGESVRVPLLLLFVVSISIACNIKAVLHFSRQEKDGFAQFTFHNGTKSEVYKLRAGEKRSDDTITISDAICNLNPTLLETFDKDPASGGERKKVSSALLEGQGTVRYVIGEQLSPYMAMRIGVGCAFGDCGRG